LDSIKLKFHCKCKTKFKRWAYITAKSWNSPANAAWG